MVNGQPLGVARWEYIYGDWELFEDDRVHFVWHDLDASGAIVATFEYIFAGGLIYERRNTDQRWRAGPIDEAGSPTTRDTEVFRSKLPPVEDFATEFIFVYVGETEVNGAQTAHYQLTLKEERLTDAVTRNTIDVFFQRAPTNDIEIYFLKEHVVLGLTNAAGGEDVLEYVVVFHDPNTDIRIDPPPADQVDMVGAEALADVFQGSPSLALWMRGRAVRAQLWSAGQ